MNIRIKYIYFFLILCLSSSLTAMDYAARMNESAERSLERTHMPTALEQLARRDQ